jgi:hypothetical protein
MARRAKSGNPPAARGVTSHLGALAHLEALLDHGGQIMLGTVKPIVGAAVAHDGKQTLAMLKRRPGETVEQLLQRLDRAVYNATNTGARVDEINQPKSDVRYELK